MHAPLPTVDLANSAYGLMQRLLAYTYAVPTQDPDKALALDLAIGLMHALVPLPNVPRLPAGRSNPGCHAGISFITLRDSSALPPGPGARRFFCERFQQLAKLRRACMRQATHAPPWRLRFFEACHNSAAQGFDLSRAAPLLRRAHTTSNYGSAPRHKPLRRYLRRKVSNRVEGEKPPYCTRPNGASTRASA